MCGWEGGCSAAFRPPRGRHVCTPLVRSRSDAFLSISVVNTLLRFSRDALFRHGLSLMRLADAGGCLRYTFFDLIQYLERAVRWRSRCFRSFQTGVVSTNGACLTGDEDDEDEEEEKKKKTETRLLHYHYQPSLVASVVQ